MTDNHFLKIQQNVKNLQNKKYFKLSVLASVACCQKVLLKKSYTCNEYVRINKKLLRSRMLTHTYENSYCLMVQMFGMSQKYCLTPL